MKVRCFLFLPQISPLENLSMQSLSFSVSPSLPLSPLSLSHHAYLCSVLLISPLASPSSVYPNFLCTFPPPSLIQPPPLTRATCCLSSYEGLRRKIMTVPDFRLCDHTNFLTMFGQSLSPFGRMELRCLAVICLHATGKEPSRP